MTAPIVFIDTETTSLRPDRRAWEIGMIVRNGREQAQCRWFVDVADLDLGNADPFSLKIGGFYDRHPQNQTPRDSSGFVSEAVALDSIERWTRGAHLVGNVVSFDAEVLANRMRANGILPSWHYHLIDIESMAVGYLHGLAREYPGSMAADFIKTGLPWDSGQLSLALDVMPPSDEDRHTALGDAQWVMRMWDAITGSAS